MTALRPLAFALLALAMFYVAWFARDEHLLTGLVVGVAGEDRFQQAAGRQLQAIEGGGAEEGLADDACLQLAARGVNDVIRAQQHIHGAAGGPLIGAVAADHAKFGLHRVG